LVSVASSSKLELLSATTTLELAFASSSTLAFSSASTGSANPSRTIKQAMAGVVVGFLGKCFIIV
jgi:hypothetical protein